VQELAQGPLLTRPQPDAKNGMNLVVDANHFAIKLDQRQLHHFDVVIQRVVEDPEGGPKQGLGFRA